MYRGDSTTNPFVVVGTSTSSALWIARERAPYINETSTANDQAGNGTRTRDPNLGKVVLYQLSYSRSKLEVMKLLIGEQVSVRDRVERQRRRQRSS
jgi:hypothetical protein